MSLELIAMINMNSKTFDYVNRITQRVFSVINVILFVYKEFVQNPSVSSITIILSSINVYFVTVPYFNK